MRSYPIQATLWFVLVFLVGTLYLFPASTARQPFGIEVTEAKIEFIDFASHFNFVKSTFLKDTPPSQRASVYSLENHLRVNSEWAGEKVDAALSFGYSPTMMVLLFPLAFFTHSTAYSLFIAFGLLSAWWQTSSTRSRLGIGIVSFFSSPALNCFHLGQSAILTGAGLLFIYEQTQSIGKSTRRHSLVLSSIVLWALTAKPPLAVTAATLLIGLRRWRPVALAAALTALTTLIVCPLLGEGWWRDYLDMLAHYDKVRGLPEYSWAFHPELMSNLRGILNVDFGIADNTASRISSALWIVVLLAIASCAPLMKLTPGGLWSFGVLSYLALCPHVSDTEEIQMILLIPFCVPISGKKLRWQDLVVLAVASLGCFFTPRSGIMFHNNRMILFSIKVALMIFVAVNYRIRKEIPEQGAVMVSQPARDGLGSLADDFQDSYL